MAHAIKNKSKRDSIFSSTNYHCFYCGIELQESNWTIDHIKPMKLGGGNGKTNLVPCCKSCNSTKGIRDIEEFRYLFSCKKQNIPYFTNEQKLFLETKGITAHIPNLESFYGEL